jgi:hypothetical protein
MKEVEMNSPLSQNDTVAAIVITYTTRGIQNTSSARNLWRAFSDISVLPL